MSDVYLSIYDFFKNISTLNLSNTSKQIIFHNILSKFLPIISLFLLFVFKFPLLIVFLIVGILIFFDIIMTRDVYSPLLVGLRWSFHPRHIEWFSLYKEPERIIYSPINFLIFWIFQIFNSFFWIFTLVFIIVQYSSRNMNYLPILTACFFLILGIFSSIIYLICYLFGKERPSEVNQDLLNELNNNFKDGNSAFDEISD